MTSEKIDERYYINVARIMEEQSEPHKRLYLSGITYRQYPGET